MGGKEFSIAPALGVFGDISGCSDTPDPELAVNEPDSVKSVIGGAILGHSSGGIVLSRAA